MKVFCGRMETRTTGLTVIRCTGGLHPAKTIARIARHILFTSIPCFMDIHISFPVFARPALFEQK
jgi:hypothetical protein